MGTWYYHVALCCRCLSSWSTCHLLLLAHSTHFQLCKGSLAAVGAYAGAIVGPLFIVDHLQSTPQAAVGWGAWVVLGVRLSLGRGRPRPRRCCPLVHPIPVIVVPCPCCLLPGPRHCCSHVLTVVVPMFSLLLSPCPCPCFTMVPVPVVIIVPLSPLGHCQQFWLVPKKVY